MWVYRRVLKISWTEKITNEEVLRRMGTGREIVRQFKTRKLKYLGHLIRHNTSQIQLLEGKIEGRRSRGRARNTWTTDITTTNGMKYYQLKRTAEDRRRWHGLVALMSNVSPQLIINFSTYLLFKSEQLQKLKLRKRHIF